MTTLISGATMAKLTAKQRKKLKPSQFALPRQGAYPINDISHARMALGMVAKHGTEGEKSKVRKAVKKKYPSIDQRSYRH